MCGCVCVVFFFKQKTAYEMRISDWSSDVCSSDLARYAGTHGFQDGAAVKRVEKRLDLFLYAGQFDGVDLFRDVDDAAAKYLGHALHFFALLAHGAHLDKHELALDVRPFGQIHHLNDIDQAVQVLGDLLDDFVGPRGNDRHARQGRVFRGRHRQGFDVVAARGKQPHHARQGARFVFQKDRNYMFHCRYPYRSSEPSSISVSPRPALTMGQTFSAWSVMKSRNTRRSLCFLNASRMAGSTSAGFSMRMQIWP